VEKYGTARQATDNNKIVKWRMRFFCWITKVTDTDAEYAVLFALPIQHDLGERPSLLHFMYAKLPVLLKLRVVRGKYIYCRIAACKYL
jgi:hypothetical protein